MSPWKRAKGPFVKYVRVKRVRGRSIRGEGEGVSEEKGQKHHRVRGIIIKGEGTEVL